MKRIKILPITSLIVLSTCSFLPLVSCNKDDIVSADFDYDSSEGPFVPTIETAKQKSMEKSVAENEYFEAINEKPEILGQDYLWSNYGAPVNKNDDIVETTSMHFEVVDIKNQLFNITLSKKMTSSDQWQTFDITYTKYKLSLMFIHNEAIIAPDITYMDTDNDWKCHLKSADSTGESEEIDIDKNSDTEKKNTLMYTIWQARFKSYYFSKIKPNPLQNDFSVETDTSDPRIEYFKVEPEEIIGFNYMVYTGRVSLKASCSVDPLNLELWVGNTKIESSKTTWFGLVGSGGVQLEQQFIILDHSFITSDKVTFKYNFGQ